MILDFNLVFTGTTPASNIGNTDHTDSPTASGTGAVSSNVIDLNLTGLPVLGSNVGARDMGVGDEPALKVLSQAVAAFSGGTSLVQDLQGAPDNGSGAPGTYATFYSTPAYRPAMMTAGARLMEIDMPRPPYAFAAPMPRFLRILYNCVGGISTGSLFSTLVLDRFDQVVQRTAAGNSAIVGGYPP